MVRPHQLLAFIVALIWGTNFVFIKYGLEELPPFFFAAIRFFLVAFPLVFFLTKPRTSWPLIIAYGLLIGFGQFGILFYAMQSDITPGLASLVVQMQVFFSIFLATILLKEALSRIQLLAFVIAFSGIFIIGLKAEGQTTFAGLLLVLTAAASWSVGNLIVKKAGQIDIIAFLAYSSLFSVPALLAMSFYFEGWELIVLSVENASMTSVYVVLWQSIGNTLVGYGLWNYLLHRYDAAVVTPWALLVPVFGMLTSNIMLAEPMPIWKIAAAMLIVSGLGVNVYASVRR
ncbi:MAG: O-acetylserine/cysteine efflux transporter [Candidatus Azotimanducaceae bacterium]